MNYLAEFSYLQLILFIIFFIIAFIIFLHNFLKLLKNNKLIFNYKEGTLSTEKDKEEIESDATDYIKDIYILINKTKEISYKQKELETNCPELQLNLAINYIKQKNSLLERLFLNLLDEKLTQKNENDGNITSHKDFILYSLILEILEIKNTILIKKYIMTDEIYKNHSINSIDFKESIKNFALNLIKEDIKILNKYYLINKEVSRSEVYKENKKKEQILIKIIINMIRTLKETLEENKKEIKELNKELNDYIKDYLDNGVSLDF
jgi:hypothetical protein